VTRARFGGPDGSADGEINAGRRAYARSQSFSARQYPGSIHHLQGSGTGIGWRHRARGTPGLPGGAPELTGTRRSFITSRRVSSSAWCGWWSRLRPCWREASGPEPSRRWGVRWSRT